MGKSRNLTVNANQVSFEFLSYDILNSKGRCHTISKQREKAEATSAVATMLRRKIRDPAWAQEMNT